MTYHPEIPKKLAAKIRSAQEKVRQARLVIESDEFNGGQARRRVDEYEFDPVAFAALYYGTNPPDSYPVQTNIARMRENIERYEARRSQNESDLVIADADLAVVEADVLVEVVIMGPSGGRIPWPQPLPSFKSRMEEVAVELAAQVGSRERAFAEREAEYDEEMLELDRQNTAEDAEYLAEIAAARAMMTPEEREREKAQVKLIKEGLDSGQLTAAQLIEWIESKQQQ